MIDKELAAIAKKHLGIATLETRKSDRLDFHDLGVGNIKAALEAAYRAGQAAPIVSTLDYEDLIDAEDIFSVTDDFLVTKVERRDSAPGTWVNGTVGGHRFEALVFGEHAENREWEIEDSQITKLWIQRMRDKKVVYSWDRGEDVPASDKVTQVIVDFLAEGLKSIVQNG